METITTNILVDSEQLKLVYLQLFYHLFIYLHFSCRLAPVFSFFVPFYLLIPRMPVTQVLGQIHITNKSLVYVVGLQVGACWDKWPLNFPVLQ